MIRKIERAGDRMRVAREILEQLPDWFGIPESREQYVRACGELPVWADFEEGRCRGFIAMKRTSPFAAEICVMGVTPTDHRQGIGTALFRALREEAERAGLHYLHVKTVREGMYAQYDWTNRFYRKLGFEELECLPELWDAQNPCQIYIMTIERREKEA